ncbi:MAG TPA: aminopeptidase [Fastidiosipila sp.]|nr:aminopeptidase [Fastidiosipila sp.]
MDLSENLKKYADLILRVGLNVKPGDNILLRVTEDGLPLAREIARQAYGAGVHHIHSVFTDDAMTLARFTHAPDEAFESYPEFFVDFSEQAYLHGFHLVNLAAPNPELLKTVSPARIGAWQKVMALASEKLMPYVMENRVKWTMAALPTPAWAASVFPDLPLSDAMEKLWENIFHVVRVDQADPVAAWREHEENLKNHENRLNELAFEKLIYQGPGTDLEVYLPEGHIWLGGCSVSPSGERFMPNIPTEEVFTMPHAYKVNGRLKATMPLATRGRIIEGMTFVFKDGAVIDYAASEGEDILQDILDTDEGARRLGEVALVAHDSPISQTGLLFKNTLFDENASCHFALGNAYAENHVRGALMDKEEKKRNGMNDSITHVDFMVGGPELNVTGVKKDGSKVKILVNGNWVI